MTKSRAEPVRVLSIRQPHADEIIHGDKWCENRSWQTHYRGELFIHASRWEPGEAKESAGEGLTGFIIGRCELVACVPSTTLRQYYAGRYSKGKLKPNPRIAKGTESIHELAESHGWTPESFSHVCGGCFCFLLVNRQPLAEPIPAKGKLNIWTFDIPK